MTPEGKIKAAINRLLERYKGMYKYMPVPFGYGASTLDYIICYRGHFVAIEAKKPGGKPTDRQKSIIQKIRAAGGTVFLIDGKEGLDQLEQYLESMNHDTHPRISEA